MGCWPQTGDKTLGVEDDDGIFWWGVGKRKEFLDFIEFLSELFDLVELLERLELFSVSYF